MSDRAEKILRYFEEQKDYVTARVQDGIEQHRKGSARIRVLDKNGNPVPGATVHARQITQDFKFGANLFMIDELETPEKNEIYKKKFPELFNLGTLPFYWADLEPEPGKPRFEKDSPKIYRRPTPDLCLEYCEQAGITPKLHCLNYDQWTPVWVPENDVSAVKSLLEKRMREIGERYAGKIPGIEVINETLCGYVRQKDRRSTQFFWEKDLTSWSFETARKYFPDNELIINETTFAWDTDHRCRTGYAMVIDQAMEKGAQIDAIGLQYHLFHRREDEERYSLRYLNPIKLYDAMDFYWNSFGKPLQVTEITVPAYSNSVEDEAIQAELIRQLYSIWFSHPAMEAIIYWNLVDGYAAFAPQGDMAAGENYYHGSLMRFDMSEKPAFKALKKLIREDWMTDTQAITDENGHANLRGFHGEYELSVHTSERSSHERLHIKKNDLINETTIVVL